MESNVNFESLELHERILSALHDAGYSTPTEVQASAIPIAMKGKDVMATAQTGTGKTAAFVLPLLQQMYDQVKDEVIPESEGKEDGERKKPKRKLDRKVKALILSPTRELAQQIEDSINEYAKYLPFNCLSVVGGLPIQRQIGRLKKGVDIIVATPGRLMDLMKRKEIRLKNIEYFVLDEADRMLDMGFVHDVQDIAKRIPKERQTLFFSATTSADVESLSSSLLSNPERIEVHRPDSVGENIQQYVYFVEKKDKRDLALHVLEKEGVDRALVFTATKSDANVLAAVLERKGVNATAIHSDKKQKERQKALRQFEEGDVRVLVATDVMARGIDVEGITHVINYDLPSDPENFVHRIGRTARAGSSGKAYSFCDLDEVGQLQSIQKFTKEKIEIVEDHPFHSPLVNTIAGKKDSPFARRGGRRGFSRGKSKARGSIKGSGKRRA